MFPVEEKIGAIRRLLAENRSVVLTAPPGSGKTTCVPPALLGEPWLAGKKIVMLEPRRLAARSCAGYIASRLGERVGGTVGYQVRLEKKTSAATRLEIVTEGLLAQRLVEDPELADTGLVIFDEFHERSLQCDLAFAMALDVRRALREDLRILAMSATLDAGELARHMQDAEIVRAEGRMFPVETRYLGDVSMAAAVRTALEQTDGDILCFLPGEGEIRRVAATLGAGAAARGALVLPLYGALPKEEQDRVFAPAPQRKIILSTSIAETSVTIEGITCVIDSGLMRRSRFTPSTGMSGLVTLPLTHDRAEQRRGRAGRVRPGVCYRLWSERDEAARAARMTPEILEADLAPLVMTCAAWGATRRDALPWLTPPAAAAWDEAAALLRRLGALDADGRITSRGGAMARLGMHPRLANMMLSAPRGRAAQTAAILAAIVEEGMKTRETDIRRILDEIRETPELPASRRILQLARRFAPRDAASPADAPDALSEGALLARAYPDRVAKNRGNGTFRMVCGRGAALEREDVLAKAPFIVCCELDDRQGDAKVFLASPISKEEIEEIFGGEIVREEICEWDRAADRVKTVERRRIGQMPLDERAIPPARDGAAAAMMDGIRAHGVQNMPCWTKEALALRARIAFLHKHCEGWPEASGDEILAILAPFLGGMTKWKDLENLDLCNVLDALLAGAGRDRRELDRLAPPRFQVPTGSNIRINYEGAEPTVEVRLQECFGLMQTPKVAQGRVPVVMTLLSPASRPIQITKDLAGFWREGYQLVRKDMRGKYPRHYWPEDPLTATPTRRTVKGMSRGA